MTVSFAASADSNAKSRTGSFPIMSESLNVSLGAGFVLVYCETAMQLAHIVVLLPAKRRLQTGVNAWNEIDYAESELWLT
jgi:hypothetical protein